MLINIFLTAAVALQAGTQPAPTTAAFKLYDTTWTYIDHGTQVRKSIDHAGNYIENAVTGQHMDHGTAVMKGGKACFSSAMKKSGEVCWTVQPVKVGQLMVTRSDTGEKVTMTRVEYVHMSMPK